jgi:hypothetical protein
VRVKRDVSSLLDRIKITCDSFIPKLPVQILKEIIVALTVIGTAVFTVPGPISFPQPGLDPSWRIGLYIAIMKNMQFGKDIVFTYGPLGFLSQPLLVDYNLWRLSLAFNLFTHILFFLSLYVLLKSIKTQWYLYFIIVPAFALVMPGKDYELLITVSFLLYAYIIKEKNITIDVIVIAAFGMLLSIASLIKFNMLIMSVLLILISFYAFRIAKKSYLYPAVLSLSYIIFILLAWCLAGQSLANFSGYVTTGIEISQGYNDAMAVHPQIHQVVLEFASIALILILLIYSIVKGNKNVFLYLLLNMAFFITSYKYGLIRNHDAFYFTIIPLFTVLSIIMLNCADIRKPCNIEGLLSVMLIILTLVLIYSLVLQDQWITQDNITTKVSDYQLSYNLMENPEMADNIIDAQKDAIKNDNPLDEQTIAYIGNKTIDIFPWDIALCWAYDMNWSPRPVFQSYSVYTQKLDEINGKYYNSIESPQLVLFSYKTIDGRYAQMDEPDTFRAVVNNYHVVSPVNNYILLEQNNDTNIRAVTGLGAKEGDIGEFISVPQISDGYLYGRIGINYTIYGNLVRLIYQPDPVYVQFVFGDGTRSPEYRLVPGTARDGLFLSSQISSTKEMMDVMQGRMDNYVSGIVIDTQASYQYDPKINIEFFRISG